MCGIAGAVVASGVGTPPSIECQLRQLDHRGRDSWGVYGSGSAVIGQTRLAIIDLVSGDPPITNEDGAIGTVLNGEIYNFADLRCELCSNGHTFKTAGDTEVIAHLAEHLTPVELARNLDGMFAFAVWDTGAQRLVLGRDRLGKKPLYYWFDEATSRFVFGSEIKSLLVQPWVRRDVDVDVIPSYLTFGYVPTPRTFFKGVRSLPPGHVLILEDRSLTVTPYWTPPVPGVDGITTLEVGEAEAAAGVRQRLKAAVARRMVADVPLGAFLSGGVDSGAVVGLMAEATSCPVRTFTIGFEDHEYDERRPAKLVADRFCTDHTEFIVHPDAVDLVERLVWHYDQPFGDSSAIPTYLLAQLTKAHVTVALSGDGGDELFAGYERFAAALAIERMGRFPASVWQPVAAAAARVLVGVRRGRLVGVRRLLAGSRLEVPKAFQEWVSFVPGEWKRALIGERPDWGVDNYLRIWEGSYGAEALDRLLNLTLRTYLLDDLLPKADRMSMAHGLEVRSPFLDTQLVEYSLRLPPSMKVQGMTGKRILKAAVADLVPQTALRRRKHGFGVPVDRWFRGELRSFLACTLGTPATRLRSLLNLEALDRLVAEHMADRANHGQALWTLLTLELFLRREGW